MTDINEFIIKKYNLGKKKFSLEIPNTDRLTLALLFFEFEFSSGAEIGTLRGEYAEALCLSNPHLKKLYCVDPYIPHPGYREHTGETELPEIEKEAHKRLEKYPVEFVKEFSPQAAERFKKNSLDFVYIDANHKFLNVVQDLCAWYPKVKHGGIIAGHDYIKHKRSRGMHVVQAVNAFVDSYETTPLFILGRKEELEGELRDRFRSWFFVKP